jgi:hypothetical protein
MKPICPHCGTEQWHANSASDSGEPECDPGSTCNECGGFVRDEEWIFEDDNTSPNVLKLVGFVISRHQITELASAHPDVTEVDFTHAKVYSASAMHELVLRFSSATMTGLEGYNKETYEWVLDAIKRQGKGE